jgi:hypothetical protein
MDPNEQTAKKVLGTLKEVEPSAFFAARVVSRTETQTETLGSQNSQLYFWKWLAAVSFSAALALAIFVQMRPTADTLVAFQPYVIHMDLNEIDMEQAASVEIELPEGVHFVSKNEEIKSAHRLELPLSSLQPGRSRLPFVVLSERTGKMPLQIHIYNADAKLVQSKTMMLTFAQERRG